MRWNHFQLRFILKVTPGMDNRNEYLSTRVTAREGEEGEQPDPKGISHQEAW
jgi:hypothetical protein